MPRKLRMPKTRMTIALTDALRYRLMLGESPAVRLIGWVELANNTTDDQIRAAWDEHAATLTAEAEAHGFRPWGATQHEPTGAGVRRWRAAFLAEHRY